MCSRCHSRSASTVQNARPEAGLAACCRPLTQTSGLHSRRLSSAFSSIREVPRSSRHAPPSDIVRVPHTWRRCVTSIAASAARSVG